MLGDEMIRAAIGFEFIEHAFKMVPRKLAVKLEKYACPKA